MIESPVLQELKEQWTREAVHGAAINDILTVLVARFGSKAQAVESALKGTENIARLNELLTLAATCRSLGAFRKRLGE